MKKLIDSIGHWEHESILEQDKPVRKQELSGGLGDNLDVDDVDREQLLMGIRVEFEHCGEGLDITDKQIEDFVDGNIDDMDEELQRVMRTSMDIAFDHLAEIDDYYTRLAAMEDQAKKEGAEREDAH